MLYAKYQPNQPSGSEEEVVLREFILWDQRLLKDCSVKIQRDYGTIKLYFLCLELFFFLFFCL